MDRSGLGKGFDEKEAERLLRSDLEKGNLTMQDFKEIIKKVQTQHHRHLDHPQGHLVHRAAADG